ncbi:hypothetical protein ZIOFF_019496 [Zingiber officinale]|uniref:Uncharacterized protein n=1 Tax=Zingiber officinale TaxID=94328 RepID=A0A8J5HEC8_ZINOF|nr:hypothetical protein ZIOFF_019496 [Zingiber officinale]
MARARGRRLFLGHKRLASSSWWGASLTTLGSIDTLSTLVLVHQSLSVALEYIDAENDEVFGKLLESGTISNGGSCPTSIGLYCPRSKVERRVNQRLDHPHKNSRSHLYARQQRGDTLAPLQEKLGAQYPSPHVAIGKRRRQSHSPGSETSIKVLFQLLERHLRRSIFGLNREVNGTPIGTVEDAGRADVGEDENVTPTLISTPSSP